MTQLTARGAAVTMNPSPGRVDEILGALAALQPVHRPVALVCAHPDDESIGMGGMLVRLPDLTLLSLTDGAPRDPAIAQAAGFPNRTAYAAARRRELVDALQALAAGRVRLVPYELMDGTLVDHLAVVIERLAADLLSVEAVFTHPYEGGHLDHDVAAFAVQEACDRLIQAGCAAPVRLEFTSYHHFNGAIRSGRFHDDPACPEIAVPLSPDAAWRKELAFNCHTSQEGNLRFFGYGPERLRPAPRYDFTRPPPTGRMMYGDREWQRLREQAT